MYSHGYDLWPAVITPNTSSTSSVTIIKITLFLTLLSPLVHVRIPVVAVV